jgi:hypothetical protein
MERRQMQNKPGAVVPAVALADAVQFCVDVAHRTRDILVDIATDFCRWRSRCAAKRAARAIAAGRRWLDRESKLIEREMERHKWDA